jgi:hypothetical protein
MEQTKEFQEKRDQLRSNIIMSNVFKNRQTYMKLMGQKVNGVKNAKLQPWEVEQVEKALCYVEQVIHQFRDELHR